MKKIFILALSFCAFQTTAQVSTLPNAIGIGNGTDPNVPFHINKSISEQIRLQGTSPYMTFYEGGNWNGYIQAQGSLFGIGTKNNFNLTFFTGDLLRISIDGSTGQTTFNQRINTGAGINNVGAMRMAGNTGDSGDVLMSLGNTTPVWSSISQNPQIGFQAYLSALLTVPNNVPTDLTGFVENFDDGNGFNHATGVYTAPSSGLYAFNVTPTIRNTNPALDVTSIIRLYKNGATLVTQQEDVFKTNISYGHTLNKLFYVKLNTNDTVIFSFSQVNASGSSLVLESNSAFFSITGYKVY